MKLQIFYLEKGLMTSKTVDMPNACIGNHANTCDYIDSLMGGNDNWNSYNVITNFIKV